MRAERALVPVEGIERSILVVRGQRVMLDCDLAEVYGVSTRRLNQQVRRNIERFPADFAFLLTPPDVRTLKLQVATSKGRGGRRKLPWVFTEHGAIMVATVLNAPRAVEASLFVVRAFVRMREVLNTRKEFAEKLAELERKLATHDVAIREIVDTIKQLAALPPPEPEKSKIGFGVKEAAAAYHRRRRRVR